MHSITKFLAAGLFAFAAIHASGVVLNEIRIDHFGSDIDEYIELKGDPGESLDGVWFIYIGDHSGEGSYKGSGTVEIAIDLTGATIPEDGHFLMIGPNLHVAEFGLGASDVDFFVEGLGTGPGLLENSDNITILLVRNFTGNGGNQILGIDDQLGDAGVDIDDDDDGVPNASLPWDEILDAVGYNSNQGNDFFYGEALGFVDAGPLANNDVPGHIYRGGDNDQWYLTNRALFETDADNNIIGLEEGVVDTPGSRNPDGPIPTFPPSIDSISDVFVQVGSVVIVEGSNLDSVTDVKLGMVHADFVVNGSNLEVTIPDGVTKGNIEVTNPDGTSTTQNLILIGDYSGALILEDFTDGLGDFNTYSVASTANWESSTYRDSASIEINGYGADVASDDWLISPAIDLHGVSGAYLQFGHERAYGGPDLEVMISSDYARGIDPSTASWTYLDPILAGESTNEVTDSGIVDLSGYEGDTVYIAFRYTSDGTDSGDGAVDRIHYFAIGGESLGWKLTDNFGWLFYETADWAVSADLGSVYLRTFPWIYQVNFEYLYHMAYAEGLGFWFYSAELEWVFVPEGSDGWFMASGNDWAWDNLKDPQQ